MLLLILFGVGLMIILGSFGFIKYSSKNKPSNAPAPNPNACDCTVFKEKFFAKTYTDSSFPDFKADNSAFCSLHETDENCKYCCCKTSCNPTNDSTKIATCQNNCKQYDSKGKTTKPNDPKGKATKLDTKEK